MGAGRCPGPGPQTLSLVAVTLHGGAQWGWVSGMPSTGSDPNQGAHTVPFIFIILHGAAQWGWVPRDPGLGGSCPVLGGCHSPQGPHCWWVFRGVWGSSLALSSCRSPRWGPSCVPIPCPHPTGAGEAELQPQEGEWDPRGALRVGQPHESGGLGKGTGDPCCACHPLGLVTHLPLSSAVPQITVNMELSVSGLEDMGDAITFHLQLRR